MSWDTLWLVPPRRLFDRSRIFYVLSRVPTDTPCNLDFGPRVVPMIEQDLLSLNRHSVSKDSLLRIRRRHLVRTQHFQCRKDVLVRPEDRIQQEVNYGIIMPRSALGRSAVVQPYINECREWMKHLESIFKSSENLYCTSRIALKMMSNR